MSIHYDDFVTGIRSLIEAWDRCSLVPTIKGESEWKDTRVAEDVSVVPVIVYDALVYH